MTKDKKQEGLNPDDFEPAALDEFVQVARKVLLKPARTRARYENKKPTKAELEQKWRLERR